MEFPVLMEIMDMVEKDYVNGTPKHLLPAASSREFDPEGSTIFVTSFSDFHRMSGREIQDIFRDRNILVTKVPVSPLQFNEDGLSTLAPLDQKNFFQGESYVYNLQLSQAEVILYGSCRDAQEP